MCDPHYLNDIPGVSCKFLLSLAGKGGERSAYATFGRDTSVGALSQVN